MTQKAVILFSGGLDSSTCIGLAQSQGYECYALTIDYQQRHRSELDAAKQVAKAQGVHDHKIVKVDLGTIGGSALTDHAIDVPEYTGDGEIPVTYVPARNTLFLSIALGYAETLEADAIFIGVSSVDYSGYPDCRPEYLEAFQTLANLATKRGVEGHPITIMAPLAHLSKAQTIQAGLAAGVDYASTVSCYQADANGLACGTCDSCVLRKKGFSDAGVDDPTRYVNA